jgi:C-terminal processing protease CtpA/Prc
MYPMLMGLAEILPLKINMGGDSKDGKLINQEWKMENGVFYYGDGSYPNIPKLKCHLLEDKSKIAVLIGRYTASSGEVVACALKSQENIQLFGEQTSGATTANQWTPIGKEVVFNPAISYYASKDKTIHKDGVIPDIEISENFNFENPISGRVFKKAVQWLIKK